MLDRRSSSACKSPNLYVGICSAPKYCNKSRMSSSYVYLLQYLYKYTLSPEPLKNPPGGLLTAVQLWSSPCCSSGLQIMVPKVPNSSPPPLTSLSQLFEYSTLRRSSLLGPFFWHNFTYPPSAQTHPTPLFESTPVFGGTGSASTWRGAGSPVNA